MKRHLSFFCLLAAETLLIISFHAFGSRGSSQGGTDGDPAVAVARALEITDLAIWTEARYTRHPSQADFFSPFQDFPGSADHFPAGSIVAPPPHIPGRKGR